MKAVPQGYTGRCWIVAGLNLLREIAVEKMDRNALPDGGFWTYFTDLVRKYGCYL